MYGEHPLSDAARCLRATATNLIAALAPGFYVRLTGQTGRGGEEESARDIADYFRRCFDDYFRVLGVAPADIPAWLAGKRVLEYGPGDCPGVALLMVAHGAEHASCVDRFPLVALSDKNQAVLRLLCEDLSGEAARRAAACFRTPGQPASGLDPRRIAYRVTPSGLSGLRGEAALVYSRAVLEHVNDLDATFRDMAAALAPGGVAIHEVDLRSHGLHQRNRLDFLTWPPLLWKLMFSHKGVPNRLRVDRYRAAAATAALGIELIEATERAAAAEVAEVRPRLDRAFSAVADEDLAWLGFWVVLKAT